jgi:hypothetical protein
MPTTWLAACTDTDLAGQRPGKIAKDVPGTPIGFSRTKYIVALRRGIGSKPKCSMGKYAGI